MCRPWLSAGSFAFPDDLGMHARRVMAATVLALALPAAHAQTITTTAFSPSAIPVDQPGALLLLAAVMAGSVGWMLRKGMLSSTTLRSAAMGAMALVLVAMLVWGDAVQAQLQELQRTFNQPGGETLTVPVTVTATALDGQPLGFLPVVYNNQTASSLRIADITPPGWNTCFPLGVPSPLPVTPARPDTACAVGTVLTAGGACWVDVAALCADAAAQAQGSHPSNLQADTVSVLPGTQAAANVLANDQDADGPLQVTRFVFQGTRYAAASPATVPGVGTLAMQSDGSYTFDAASPFTGTSPLMVPYTVQTGASSHLQITVLPGNRAPVAVNDAATTNEGTAIEISVRTNDTDADGDVLTVSGVTQGANGSVVIDAVTNNPIYIPNTGYTGTDQFTYTIVDGNGGTATATVTVTVNAVVNRAPVAVDDSFFAGSGPLTITRAQLLVNDTDADGDTLTIVSVQNALNGTVSLIGGNVVFTATAGYEGDASFTYTIEDPSGAASTATVTVRVGSAMAPSVVVLKSLVAIAQGTGGTSIKFPITTALVDTDGSETLSIRISGVPTGLSFNAGTNQGGGVWQFTESDLPNLTLNLPGSHSTSAANMTVQVTATESANGTTAATSTVVTLRAAYTTVDVFTTESGNYTGSNANEFIQGGNGNNVINGGNGSNIIYGGAGNDTLSAGVGSDVIYGGSGDDIINAGSGSDVLVGGSGNDTMTGGEAGENFVDVFVWSLGDQGAAGTPAIDTIHHFSTATAGSNGAGGDVLNLQDLLQGERVGPANAAGNLANYLHFSVAGGDTILHISHTGGFSADSHTIGAAYASAAETQRIILTGVNLQSLYAGATQDGQIITQLLNNHKLIVD